MVKLFVIAAMVGSGANSGVSLNVHTVDFKTEAACLTAAQRVEQGFKMRWASGEISAWCIVDGGTK